VANTVQAPILKKVAVVLTAIQAETEAVLGHLEAQTTTRVVDTWFHIGRFGLWTVALAEVGPGNAPAATIAVRAFTHFKPEVAAFVGIAGGLKDVVLGDVVVATKVYGYESGKEMPHGFRTRPDVQTSHHELQARARIIRIRSPWHDRLDPTLWSDRKPTVHVGPIAAGEAVVADNAGRIATHLKQHYGDALAVEMEGRGFLEAAHIDPSCRAVVVRGISDLLASKAATDRAGWQRRSADSAAAFFFEMLAFEGGANKAPSDHDQDATLRVTALDASASPDTNATPRLLTRPRLSRRALGRTTMNSVIGHQLSKDLTQATENSRHLALQDERGIVIGILLDPDEFNLLMKLSGVIFDLAAISDMMRGATEDSIDDELTSEEVFGTSANDKNDHD